MTSGSMSTATGEGVISLSCLDSGLAEGGSPFQHELETSEGSRDAEVKIGLLH